MQTGLTTKVANNSETIHYLSPDQLTVVSQKHPLAPQLYTTRNDFKLSPNFIESIRGGILEPVLVMPFNDELVVIAGNQRVKAAREVGIQVPVIFRDDWTLEDAVQASAEENAQRKDNDFYTDLMVVSRLLKIDEKTGKPTGKSYEEVAQIFDKSHQWVRNIIAVGKLPTKVRRMVQSGKLSFTAAVTLTRKELSNNPEALEAAIEELLADESNVGVTKGRISVAKAKRVSGESQKFTPKEWRALAQHEDTPDEFRPLIQFFVGDITLATAHKLGLDWLKRIAPTKKEKAKKEKKEKASSTVVSEEVDIDSLFA